MITCQEKKRIRNRPKRDYIYCIVDYSEQNGEDADIKQETKVIERVRSFLNILTVVTVAIFSIFVLYRVVYTEQQRDAEQIRFIALQELTTVRARIEGLLNANLISMRSLRVEFSLQPEIDDQRFTTLMRELLTEDLHTRHVAIAPDLVVSHIYPLEGNEGALGLDYRNVPEQFSSIQAAMEVQDIVINGPVNLVQGGTALIARVPVYIASSGEFWGVISQVIEHERLIADAGLHASDSFLMGLRNNEAGSLNEVISGEAAIWTHDPVQVQVALPQGNWTLAAFPKTGSWQRPLSSYSLYWIGGGLICLLIIILTFIVLNSLLKLRQAFSTISHQARYDALTSLPNRHHFMSTLTEQLKNKQRDNKACGVLFIDLDHFKEINDSLGHEAGDDLLIEIAKRLRATLRNSDLVARFGGDEFVVLLNELEEPLDAEFLANKLLLALSPVVRIAEHDVMIQGSIGIAIYPEDGLTPSDLVKHADLAMYAAKSAGRGTSYFFNESLRNQAEAHLQLHREILRGLQEQQFKVFYQPIIHFPPYAPHGEICKVEALIRWNHPEYGIISPAHFIPVAEKTGTIRELGQFVLEQACSDYHRFREQGLPLAISINRSSREFNEPRATVSWLKTIDSQNVSRQDITFEITESVLMPDKERQHQMLLQLADGGVELSIDDFGTGYSSVTYLRNFPVSQIKIDRAFLQGIPENPQQLALVEAIIKMANALNLNVVAEGVEKETQANCLKALKCEYLQGFLYARPVSIEEIIDLYNPNSGIAAERIRSERSGVGQ
ncbi:MAG: EAL domain [Idiomarinaceae bacterium HL-53]|nr:MAG: EAL domain [Idiomarinaceae bacterium HL-53]CUS47403.1 periplasmic sensor diguanylate cyclase/phosphodiesterase [Idiomarinaceae bacterium HL-53]